VLWCARLPATAWCRSAGRRPTIDVTALEARWRSQTAAKLKLARGVIREAEVKWPELTNCLNATGLGSDLRLIQKPTAWAERRPGQR